MVRYSPNFKLRLMRQKNTLQMNVNFNGIHLQMEDYLKLKYLSNYWLDLLQISNLGLCDQIKLYGCFKWRWHPMEDDLNWKTTSNIKIEISKQLLVRSSPNVKLKLMGPKQTLEMFQLKMTSNYQKWCLSGQTKYCFKLRL